MMAGRDSINQQTPPLETSNISGENAKQDVVTVILKGMPSSSLSASSVSPEAPVLLLDTKQQQQKQVQEPPPFFHVLMVEHPDQLEDSRRFLDNRCGLRRDYLSLRYRAFAYCSSFSTRNEKLMQQRQQQQQGSGKKSTGKRKHKQIEGAVATVTNDSGTVAGASSVVGAGGSTGVVGGFDFHNLPIPLWSGASPLERALTECCELPQPEDLEYQQQQRQQLLQQQRLAGGSTSATTTTADMALSGTALGSHNDENRNNETDLPSSSSQLPCTPQTAPEQEMYGDIILGCLDRTKVGRFLGLLAGHCHSLNSRALALAILERSAEADLAERETRKEESDDKKARILSFTAPAGNGKVRSAALATPSTASASAVQSKVIYKDDLEEFKDAASKEEEEMEEEDDDEYSGSDEERDGTRPPKKLRPTPSNETRRPRGRPRKQPLVRIRSRAAAARHRDRTQKGRRRGRPAGSKKARLEEVEIDDDDADINSDDDESPNSSSLATVASKRAMPSATPNTVRSAQVSNQFPNAEKASNRGTEQSQVGDSSDSDSDDDVGGDEPDRLKIFLAGGGLPILRQWLVEASTPAEHIPDDESTSTTPASPHRTRQAMASEGKDNKRDDEKDEPLIKLQPSPTGPLLLALLEFLKNQLPFDLSMVTQSKINKHIAKLSRQINSLVKVAARKVERDKDRQAIRCEEEGENGKAKASKDSATPTGSAESREVTLIEDFTDPIAGGLSVLAVHRMLNELKARWQRKSRRQMAKNESSTTNVVVKVEDTAATPEEGKVQPLNTKPRLTLDPFANLKAQLQSRLEDLKQYHSGGPDPPRPSWLPPGVEPLAVSSGACTDDMEKNAETTEQLARKERASERSAILKENLKKAAEERAKLLQTLRNLTKRNTFVTTSSDVSSSSNNININNTQSEAACRPPRGERKRVMWKDGLTESKERRRDLLEQVFVYSIKGGKLVHSEGTCEESNVADSAKESSPILKTPAGNGTAAMEESDEKVVAQESSESMIAIKQETLST